MSAAASPLRIIGIEVNNFKRLRAVRIHPGGRSLVVGGRNAQGKSSLLDSIAAALCGRHACPTIPIRTGERRGEVTVDLGAYVITRKWDQKGDELIVKDHEGVQQRSPQALLDSIVGDLSFDPLAFATMKPKEQVETLRRLVGLDFSELDQERQQLYDKRTAVNADAKRLEIEGRGIQLPDVNGLQPAEVIDIRDLLDQRKLAAQEHHRQREAQRQLESWREFNRRMASEIADLERQLAAKRAKLEEGRREETQREQLVSASVDPGLESLDEKIAQAEGENDRARKVNAKLAEHDELKARRQNKLAEAQARKDESERMTDRIQEIEDEKVAMLKEAAYPIPGLGMTWDAVTMHGVPFDQASAAERLLACMAIGAELNKRLRMVRISNGALLDDESLAMALKFADEKDLQLFVEVVGKRDGRRGGD